MSRTVDKFGHYYNQQYISLTLKEHVSRFLGINTDENNNLDIQNKKIRNVGAPAEGADAVNQAYVHSQIKHIQEILKQNIDQECAHLRQEISQLKKTQNELFKILSQYPFKSPTLIYHTE